MKKQVKELIYKFLLWAGWIEDKEEQIKYEFYKLVDAYKMSAIVDHKHKYVTLFTHEGIRIEWQKVPFVKKPYLETIYYFAYFGIREKNGEGFRKMSEEDKSKFVPYNESTAAQQLADSNRIMMADDKGIHYGPVNRSVNKQYESEPVVSIHKEETFSIDQLISFTRYVWYNKSLKDKKGLIDFFEEWKKNNMKDEIPEADMIDLNLTDEMKKHLEANVAAFKAAANSVIKKTGIPPNMFGRDEMLRYDQNNRDAYELTGYMHNETYKIGPLGLKPPFKPGCE